MQITGCELFIKALNCEGVDTIFAYPGGYVIPIFDELYKQDDITLILPRHEQALVHEADGYARSTGKVGVCLVTSGPGATNTITGLATANYDSVPLVCFCGQCPTWLIGNDAFQEVDIAGISRPVTKHSIVVTDRKDLGRIIKEAFYIASHGKPGTVVVDLPSDVMNSLGDDTYPEEANIRSYRPNTNVHLGQLKKAVSLLNHGKKPLFLAGGGVNIARANKEFTKLVNLTKIPVVTTIMGKGSIPTSSPYYVGNLGMHGCYAANQAVSECDVLFSIGTRFNDRITGRIKDFAPHAQIIHVDIDAASISRNIKVDVPIVADAKKAITAMLDMVKPSNTTAWRETIAQWNKEHPLQMPEGKGLTPSYILQQVNDLFHDSIVVTDVGQHQMWCSQFIQLDENKKLLTSGGLGTMGYGLPAAIGAKIACPDKTVICISGDGGMQMNIQELATAVTQELPIIVLIFNNSYLGMVRQWQQLFHDRRYSGTCLRERKSCKGLCGTEGHQCPPYTPDFVKLAESYGAKGIRVTKNEQIQDALQEAAKATDSPVVIECIIDSEMNVLPMVKSGSPLTEMILEVEG